MGLDWIRTQYRSVHYQNKNWVLPGFEPNIGVYNIGLQSWFIDFKAIGIIMQF